MVNNYLRGGRFVERQRLLDPNYTPPTTAPAVTTPPTGGNQPPIPGGSTWIQPPPPTITTPPTGGNTPPIPGGSAGGETYPGSGVYTQPGFISTPGPSVSDDNLNPFPGGRVPSTGGNLPPIPGLTTPPTGGNQPPIPGVGRPPMTGGNQPPIPANPQVPLQGGFSPVNVVQDTLNQIIDPNGAYMRNAARRGIEQAAARGISAGSSIAAGASQRAALESAMPLVNEALGLQRQREGYAFQGEQAQLDRNHDYTRAQIQDWMNSNQFRREFYGALSMMPINSAMNLQSMLQQYALENPEVYTPSMINGMSNFFAQNFSQVISRYFGNYFNTGTGGGG